MPTPIDHLSDPLSWTIMAMFLSVICWEALFPGRKLPYVRFWMLKGILAFLAYFFISSYLPLFLDPLLQPYRLIDLSHLHTLQGGLLGLMVYELGLYLWHFSMHKYTILWRIFHQMHHSAERLDAASAFYFSPWDMFGWTVLGSVSFSLLVGLSPQSITFVLLSTTFFSIFQHANIRTPRWLGYIIQRPESHSYHHAKGIHQKNYADLPILDIIFGTFHNPTSFEPETGFYPGASGEVLKMLLFKDLNDKDHIKNIEHESTTQEHGEI